MMKRTIIPYQDSVVRSVVATKFGREVCGGSGHERLGSERPSRERLGRMGCEALVVKARS